MLLINNIVTHVHIEYSYDEKFFHQKSIGVVLFYVEGCRQVSHAV